MAWAWELDYNTGAANPTQRMLFFDGSAHCFVCTLGAGGGLFERVSDGNWTQRIVGVSKVLGATTIRTSCAALWDTDKIWFADSRYVYWSYNGEDWNTDFDINTWSADYAITAMNAYGDYLYLIAYDHISGFDWEVHFARRDHDGNWDLDFAMVQASTSAPPMFADIIGGVGPYVYWSASSAGLAMRRWDGASWGNDPSGLTRGHFTAINSVLYFCNCSATEGGKIYRRTAADDWTLDCDDIKAWFVGIGQDNRLWTTNDYPIAVRRRNGVENWPQFNGLIDFDPDWSVLRSACCDQTLLFAGTDIAIGNAKIYKHDLVSYGLGISPWNYGDSKALICDHQYGDTLYIGLRDTSKYPFIDWLDANLVDWETIYHATAGSVVGVQTVDLRDTCIGFGQFGTDKQVIITENLGGTWDETQGEFSNDEVTTLQFHPTSGSDLVATRRVDQDLIQTLTQRTPWTDKIATPFVARSQLRVQDDIFIGSDTPNAQPVKMWNPTAGSWTNKSNGLPTTAAINDLELGF